MNRPTHPIQSDQPSETVEPEDPLTAREEEALALLQDPEEPPLSVRVSQRSGVTVVRVEGELELFTAEILRRQLAEVVESKPARAVVDLSAVNYIDSSGLGVLLQAARSLPGRLTVVTPRDRVARLFRISGLSETIQLCATLAEALA